MYPTDTIIHVFSVAHWCIFVDNAMCIMHKTGVYFVHHKNTLCNFSVFRVFLGEGKRVIHDIYPKNSRNTQESDAPKGLKGLINLVYLLKLSSYLQFYFCNFGVLYKLLMLLV